MEKNGCFQVTLYGETGYRFAAWFDDEDLPGLVMDEPPPLGDGDGPNAARVLAAAIGDCLSASLVHCLHKARIELTEFRTVVDGTLERNERGRLRIGPVRVRLEPEVDAEDVARMARCLDLFEDFCIVTESVRSGIDVRVEVAPTTVRRVGTGTGG